jgi:hypothetical protein
MERKINYNYEFKLRCVEEVFYLDKVSIDEMISFYEQRYPYTDCSNIKSQFVNFESADLDYNPSCLLDKSWVIIKLDFFEKM